jgi:PAS domain-containing protein
MDADRTEANPLRDQLNVMRSRMDHLRDRLTHQSLLAREDAVADLQTSLEELQTANEELRARSDELAIVRHQLELERQRYQDLFDFAPDGYIVTDAAGTIREINCAAARMLGVDSRHLVGKPLATYVNSSDVRAFRSAVNSVQPGFCSSSIVIGLPWS